MADKRIDEATGVETVGHEWDGIEELNNPLPRWWIWTFYACIAFAIGYVILYPAIPMLNKGTAGVLGWTSRGALAAEIKQQEETRSKAVAGLAALPIEDLQGNEPLMRAAVAGGRAAFKVNCVQCHGSGAAGSAGFPNLNDDDWLWGGDLKAIETTVTHGIRQPGDNQTRFSQMPAFGRDGILDGRRRFRRWSATCFRFPARGRQMPPARNLFEQNCAVCHGPTAKGCANSAHPI